MLSLLIQVFLERPETLSIMILNEITFSKAVNKFNSCSSDVLKFRLPTKIVIGK